MSQEEGKKSKRKKNKSRTFNFEPAIPKVKPVEKAVYFREGIGVCCVECKQKVLDCTCLL